VDALIVALFFVVIALIGAMAAIAFIAGMRN